MVKGQVKGHYWSTKRLETVPHGALLDVELDNGARIIAFDPLGCGIGEMVLVTQGSVAAAYFDKAKVPVDALIIGSLDEPPAKLA
jgi:ethanolamine utilization protein EutN